MLELAVAFQGANVRASITFDAFQNSFPELAQRVNAHATRFAWTYFGYLGPAFSPEMAFERALELSLKNDLPIVLSRQRRALDDLRKKQARDAFKLALDDTQAWAVHVARESVYLKTV